MKRTEINIDEAAKIELDDSALSNAIEAATEYNRAGFDPREQLEIAIRAYLETYAVLGMHVVVQYKKEGIKL